MVATAFDANNQLLPIAFALVDTEDDECWGWFMRWLRAEVIDPGRHVTVISDRHRSILNVFNDPGSGHSEANNESVHRYCARHISQNVRSRSDKRCSELFEAAAYTKNKVRFDQALIALKEQNIDAWQYVREIGTSEAEARRGQTRHDKWAARYDGGCRRWGMMTSNGPESLNKVFLVI